MRANIKLAPFWMLIFFFLILFAFLSQSNAWAMEKTDERSFSLNRKIMFSCPTTNIEEFKNFAVKAAALGATHVYISDLPKSIWQWNIDRYDPYPNWGMLTTGFFKIIMPPQLEKFLPADYSSKNREVIAQRGSVLKSLGLKAAFSGKEPSYLPEAVFVTHPDWRGPRCEHPRRARNTYYAPCVDQPEVQAMYRQAVAALCRLAPIESFSLLTNDSGGGICWSVSLYPGQNGPAWCEQRSYADRVVGFLSTIQAGAKDAGFNADISMYYGSGYISQAEIASVIPALMPGQSINGKTREGLEPSKTVGYSFYDSGTGPVLAIPQMMRIAEQLESAISDPGVHINYNFMSSDSPELFALIEQFQQHHYNGLLGRIQALRAVAMQQAGEANADALMAVWERIDRAISAVRSSVLDPFMLVGTVNQRWLTRPLVPFPLELLPEEKEYYRKFQFQANSEEEAADLMNLQGFEMINGYSGSLWASTMLNNAINNLQSALNHLYKIREQSVNKTPWELLAMRIKTLICFYRNARNTIQYQDILDRTDYDHPPMEENIYPMDGDQKLREIQNITRNEIDNINELIDLLESTKTPLVQLASTPAEEDIFLIGPNLVEQLRKKVQIMLMHQLKVHRLYKRRQG